MQFGKLDLENKMSKSLPLLFSRKGHHVHSCTNNKNYCHVTYHMTCHMTHPAHLELVLLAVDNHSRDLLIQEDEDGSQGSGHNGKQCNPPVLALHAQGVDDPVAVGVGGLELAGYDELGGGQGHGEVH